MSATNYDHFYCNVHCASDIDSGSTTIGMICRISVQKRCKSSEMLLRGEEFNRLIWLLFSYAAASLFFFYWHALFWSPIVSTTNYDHSNAMSTALLILIVGRLQLV